jgi:hypothetical protein
MTNTDSLNTVKAHLAELRMVSVASVVPLLVV